MIIDLPYGCKLPIILVQVLTLAVVFREEVRGGKFEYFGDRELGHVVINMGIWRIASRRPKSQQASDPS